MSIRMLSGREPQRLPENLRHELLIRQMPVEARASARKHQERRALDPLPVVELVFFEPAGGDATDSRVSVPLYQLTGYTLFAALVDADSEDEVEHLSDGKTNALCGAFISSLFPVPDPATEDQRSTLFFVFPDLGVRATGCFRLRFTLSLLGPRDCSTRMSVCSAPFNVVTAANYGGVQNSTPLTRALAAHGAHARIRKKARGARPRRRLNFFDSPSSSESGFSPETPRSPVHVPSATCVRTSERTPRGLGLFLHSPQPRYPVSRSRSALATLLVRAAERGASRPASRLPVSVGVVPSIYPQQRELPDAAGPIDDLPLVAGLEMAMTSDEALATVMASPNMSAEDIYLAEWYSDGFPGMVPVGWLTS